MVPRTIHRTQDLTSACHDEYIFFGPCNVCTISLLTIATVALVLILLLENHHIFSIFVLLFLDYVIYQVIRSASYEIAMLRGAQCTGLQKNQPSVLFKAGSTVSFEGTADEERQNPNMWHVSHLNAQKALNNLSKYKNIRNGQPNRKWKNTFHRGMSGGTVSMSQTQLILLLTEWNSRNTTRMRSLEVKPATLSLETAEETLANIESDAWKV